MIGSDVIWLVMIASGLLTFAARFSMIGLFQDRELPQIIKQISVH